MGDIGYSAFISYNHRDRRWAVWLHRALERYRVPKRLRGRGAPFGTIEAKLPPVFRDRDELAASSDLAQSVRDGLEASAMLIVLCSPHGARSKWVNEEIRTFIALGRRDRIRCLVVDGEPHAEDPAQECLPPALFEGSDAEPLAADLRKDQDGKSAARLKLIAGILGVPYDELRQREAVRRQQRLAIFATAASIGFLLMGGLAIFALISRAEAVRQRDIARQRTITAERTVAFVKSMFEVSDPSEARGATITAREVLDRGARQIEEGLGDEPAVKAELGVTLGEVYGSLGLYRQGDRLIRRTFGLPHDQPSVRARQLLAWGESQARLGHYDQAIAAYRQAIPLARTSDSLVMDLLPRMLARLAEALRATGDNDGAVRAAREALYRDLRRTPRRPSDIARDLEVIGANAFDRGELDPAKAYIARALLIRLREEGGMSPSVNDNVNMLGNIAQAEGDLERAERYFRRNLAFDEKVLGPDHPDLAGTLNNLAWVLLQRRGYGEAGRLLDRALAINLRERDETHDDLAFVFANLAMARKGEGRSGEAEALLGKALAAARAHDHWTLPFILTDLAEIQCETGRAGQGLARLQEARRLLVDSYAADSWERAWTASTAGECQLRAGRRDMAARLFAQSTPVLRARWTEGTHFRDELERRLADL